MYTLRRIFKDGSYSNRCLGNQYTVVDSHIEKRFEEIREHVFGNSGEGCDVACFVTNYDGSEILPVYKDETAFIMTEAGKTFERLRF